MRRLWLSACLLLLVIALIAFAQSADDRRSNPGDVSLVAKFLDPHKTLFVSVEGKRITRMRDSVAPAIIEAIGKATVSRPVLERILGLLKDAFERPAIITHPADRKPAATLALLRQLEQDPSWDAQALLEIASTRQYVIAAVSK